MRQARRAPAPAASSCAPPAPPPSPSPPLCPISAPQEGHVLRHGCLAGAALPSKCETRQLPPNSVKLYVCPHACLLPFFFLNKIRKVPPHHPVRTFCCRDSRVLSSPRVLLIRVLLIRVLLIMLCKLVCIRARRCSFLSFLIEASNIRRRETETHPHHVISDQRAAQCPHPASRIRPCDIIRRSHVYTPPLAIWHPSPGPPPPAQATDEPLQPFSLVNWGGVA